MSPFSFHNFSKKYLVNLGVWLKQLGDADFPKEWHCHIRCRLSSLAGDDIEKASDFEDDAFSDAQRASTLKAGMQCHGIPFLEACGILGGVRQLLLDGTLAGMCVQKKVLGLCQP
jgi:hypothetical protein